MFAAFRKKQRPEIADGANRRRDVRYQVDLQGMLESAGRLYPATVSDLSASGALISAELSLQRGTEIVLRVAELGTLPARIAHCGNGFFGVEFQNASEHRDRINEWLRSQFGASA